MDLLAHVRQVSSELPVFHDSHPHISVELPVDTRIDIEAPKAIEDNSSLLKHTAMALFRFGHAYAYVFNAIDDLPNSDLANLSILDLWNSDMYGGLMDSDLLA